MEFIPVDIGCLTTRVICLVDENKKLQERIRKLEKELAQKNEMEEAPRIRKTPTPHSPSSPLKESCVIHIHPHPDLF